MCTAFKVFYFKRGDRGWKTKGMGWQHQRAVRRETATRHAEDLFYLPPFSLSLSLSSSRALAPFCSLSPSSFSRHTLPRCIHLGQAFISSAASKISFRCYPSPSIDLVQSCARLSRCLAAKCFSRSRFSGKREENIHACVTSRAMIVLVLYNGTSTEGVAKKGGEKKKETGRNGFSACHDRRIVASALNDKRFNLMFHQTRYIAIQTYCCATCVYVPRTLLFRFGRYAGIDMLNENVT